MDIAATIPYGETRNHDCDYCGASLRVEITKQNAHNEQEEYYCPECGKEYTTSASLSPNVFVEKPRTDGKDDKYTS